MVQKISWRSSLVADLIRKRHEEGYCLSLECMRKSDPKLVNQAIQHYGTWEKAIKANQR